jgi:hypothetical protein
VVSDSHEPTEAESVTQRQVQETRVTDEKKNINDRRT